MKSKGPKDKVRKEIRHKKPSSKASIDHARYQEVINTYATVHSKHNSTIVDNSTLKQRKRLSKSPASRKSFDSNDENNKIKLLKAPINQKIPGKSTQSELQPNITISAQNSIDIDKQLGRSMKL